MNTISTSASVKHESTLAKSIAAEDLRRGDMVAILNEICEMPSYLWHCEVPSLSPHEPVRIQWRGDGGGIPLRVKAVCLPFVFVKSPFGLHDALDVRYCHLVRLRNDYARLAWKALRKQTTRLRTR